MDKMFASLLGKRPPPSRSPGDSPRANLARPDLDAATVEELRGACQQLWGRVDVLEERYAEALQLFQQEKHRADAAEQRAEQEAARATAAEQRAATAEQGEAAAKRELEEKTAQLAAAEAARTADRQTHAEEKKALEERQETLDRRARGSNLMVYGAPLDSSPATTSSTLQEVLGIRLSAGERLPFHVIALPVKPGARGKSYKVQCNTPYTKWQLLRKQKAVRQQYRLRFDLDLTPQQQALRRAQYPLGDRCREAGGRPFFRGTDLVIRPAPGAEPIPAERWLQAQQARPQQERRPAGRGRQPRQPRQPEGPFPGPPPGTPPRQQQQEQQRGQQQREQQRGQPQQEQQRGQQQEEQPRGAPGAGPTGTTSAAAQ